tara:strand:- start:1305 stop:1508 length:204 start_codon:yes stop_codon:yes gene_type:complete
MLTLGVLCSGGLGFDTLVKIKNNYEIKFILTDKKSLDIIQFSKEKNIPLFSEILEMDWRMNLLKTLR